MAVERETEGAQHVTKHVRFEERIRQSDRLASGTLACPACDAPVSPVGRMSPAHAIGCPFCGHSGAVRDFLSLTAPARPARVVVRVVR